MKENIIGVNKDIRKGFFYLIIQLFKQKDIAGPKPNWYILFLNKFRLKIRELLSIRRVCFLNKLAEEVVEAEKRTSFR